MSIRDALAAEGNAPIVFMGGTCAGPKWRERLVGQVSKSFRWFNPVVAEWTDAAKETELVVRAEADVLLYAITPYQDGCYSYLEMTEDAIRSEKAVVVAFLPSFEDKAFSEQQWNSIVSAKRLLERNNATVVLSMEELIDWFNRYNEKAPDSKLLDTSELVRKAAVAEQPPADAKAAPVTAAGLVNAVQEERAQDFSKPAQAEPGTTPAVSDGGTSEVKAEGTPTTESLSVSQEGLLGWLRGLFGSKDGSTPVSKADSSPRLSLNKASREIEKTLGNAEWLRENWNLSSVKERDWNCLLVNSKVASNPESALNRMLGEVKAYSRQSASKLERYAKAISKANDDIQKDWETGRVDDDGLSAVVVSKIGNIPVVAKDGESRDSWLGGYSVKLACNKDEAELVEVQHGGVSSDDVTPELLAAYVRGVLDVASSYLNIMDDWEYEYPYDFFGIDLTEGYWRSNALTDAANAAGAPHHSDGIAGTARDLLHWPVLRTADAMVTILNNADIISGKSAVTL